MKTVDIVTHCWAKQLEQYGWHLLVQLSSLWHHARGLPVKVLVCHSMSDDLTCNIVSYFAHLMPEQVHGLPLREGELFRRAIGRNKAALWTSADIVWYTDVDYFFGEGCLASLCNLPDSELHNLMMPRQCLRNIDWDTGDALVARLRAKGIEVCDLPPVEEFKLTRERKPIGGMQIVPGDFAREHGYLKDTKWMGDVSVEEGFRQCKCDVSYRSRHKIAVRRIDVPNVFRIRHNESGRDYPNE